MKISCPSCQSSYKIADEKVQGRTVKVRCRKCGLMIHVNERGVTSDTADAAGTAEAQPGSAMHDTSQALFSVLIAEGEQRDMNLQEVVAAYNSGQVTADTFVWADGQPDWMPLAQVPAIVDALNAASAAVDQVAAAAPAPEPEPPAPEPAPAPSPSPAEAAPLKRSSEPLARSSAPAPQPAGGMFGTPAPAPQPAGGMFGTPAPAAAVREERRAANVDLFGQARASVEDEVATSAPAFAPIASPPKATGARDEQSVLFSLAALTAAAQSAPSGGGGPSAAGGKDDSGLIDLKALSNQPATGAGPAAMPGPVAILDAAPVLGTPLMDTSYAQLAAPEEAPAKKSYGLIIGIGVAVAGLAIAGAIVFVAMNKSGQQNAAMTAPTVTETAPAPTPTPTPPPPSTDGSAAAPPTGAPTTTAAPTNTGKSAGPRTTGGKTPSGTSTKGAETGGAATPPPATTKAPPKNKCNCPPGDLACNMACAVH